MPVVETTEPRSGVKYGWAEGTSGLKDQLDSNWLILGRLGFHPSVLDRDVTDPSVLTPADGDSYIVAASAVGDWVGQDGSVAVWDEPGAAWVFAAPRVGWSFLIEDESVRSTYLAGGWSAGVAV